MGETSEFDIIHSKPLFSRGFKRDILTIVKFATITLKDIIN